MALSKRLRYAGFAEETEYDPDVPPEADFHVDISSTSMDAPGDTQMTYEGGLERGQRLHRPGWYSPSGDVVYAFDIRTITSILKWTLGGYTYDTTDTTHEIYADEDLLLPSFTTRLGKDVFEHVFTGCSVDSLEISVDNEFTQATISLASAKDARADIKEINDLNLPDEYPMAFHEVTAKIGGSDQSALIKNLTLSISNGLDADQGRSIGSRFARRIPVGERGVTLSMDMWYENTDQLERMWGDPDGPSATGSAEVEMEIEFDAGADGSMSLLLPRVVYTQVGQTPSGRGEIVQSIQATCFVDDVVSAYAGTVQSEILATIQNSEDDLT